MKLTRTQPGLMPSQPRVISRSNSCERSRSMPSRRWPYGPAQEQPPRDWMPNRSLRSATTKLWCRYRPSRRAHDERDDREPSRRRGCPGSRCSGCSSTTSIARRMKDSSRSRIASSPTASFELEHEAGADRLDDRRRAALLAMLDVGQVAVFRRGSRRRRCRRPAPRARGCGTARVARRAGPAYRARRSTCAARGRSRPCSRAASAPGPISMPHVRRGRREIPERRARRTGAAGSRRRGCP